MQVPLYGCVTARDRVEGAMRTGMRERACEGVVEQSVSDALVDQREQLGKQRGRGMP